MSESERLSAAEFVTLQKGLRALAQYEVMRDHLRRQYDLGPLDGIDDETGEIKRGAVPSPEEVSE